MAFQTLGDLACLRASSSCCWASSLLSSLPRAIFVAGPSLSFQTASERFLSALSPGCWQFNAKCLGLVAPSFPATLPDFRRPYPCGCLRGYFSPLSGLFPQPPFGLLSPAETSAVVWVAWPTNLKSLFEFPPVSPDRVFILPLPLCPSAREKGNQRPLSSCGGLFVGFSFLGFFCILDSLSGSET